MFFEGEAITGEPPERTVARGIVQVPGGRGIFPGLTVDENLQAWVGSSCAATAPSWPSGSTTSSTLFPRLGERAAPARRLVVGRRTADAHAGAVVPAAAPLLLIDELSLGLAPTVVQELLEAVRAMNRAGTTIVIVEQSVNVALNLAERGVLLGEGRGAVLGATAELLERRDLLRSVFLEGASKRPRARK